MDLDSWADDLEEVDRKQARMRDRQSILSQTDLTADYDFPNLFSSCMRMAAAGKINSKNAFNMKLIDCLKEFVSNENISNFEIASSSLDAGTKIYAGRVDAVHTETYKILTGLGKPSKKGPSEEDQGDENPADDSVSFHGEGEPDRNPIEDEKRKKREELRKRAQNRKNIICKNLNKIRSRDENRMGCADPIFTHQSRQYDDGRSLQLRLNQTDVKSDSCELFLDSEMSLFDQQSETKLNEPQIQVSFIFI
ncbi:hypothetical protein Ciccas_008197 [Cichlidogyrus casuarinus]|uniref:Condensin complex subunit 2 n=1 Tax=Cichlidogyrus casuarinus TaxID=1844966 RepID=A0ABD2Q0S0_9PLAT